MKKRLLGYLTVAKCHKNDDEGLLNLIEDYFFKGDVELPHSKYFTYIDRKLLWTYLLWLLRITEYNEDDNEYDLQIDDVEMEVDDHLTYDLEGTISLKNTKLKFQLQSQP